MRNTAIASLAVLALLSVNVTADAKGGLVKSTPEIKESVALAEKFVGFAKRDCEAKFEVFYDLRNYDTYAYDDTTTREKLLSTGWLGKSVTEILAELSSSCRTFSGNKPTTCVPHIQKLKKIVFMSHPKLDAKNNDGSVAKAGGDTLKIIYPPDVGGRGGHYLESIEALFDCDHGTARD